MVADKVIDHIRSMYPDALNAAPASAFTSLRNFTANAAQSAILSAVEEEREACAKMASDKANEYYNVGEEDLDFCAPIAVRLSGLASAIRNRKGA